MADLRIINKKSSAAARVISKKMEIPIYNGESDIDAIINYGLCGNHILMLENVFPNFRKIPVINKYVGASKFLAVKDAEVAGVKVPETRMSLPMFSTKKDWIEKKIHSSQGRGIVVASQRKSIPGKYYQRMITNRRYELRVHAFSWIPVEEWRVFKRTGDKEVIAWNFAQGGKFSSVENANVGTFKTAKSMSLNVLDIRHMAFGAVDFIVDDDLNVYFLEINSSPGFTALSAEIYFDAMRKLKELSAKEILKYTNKV